MSAKKVEFLNPDKLPVENVVLTLSNAGVIQRIKALDTYWVTQKEMIPYEAPPPPQSTVLGAVDNWLAVMEVYLEDLKWLLSLKYHVFWSTVIYHPKCMDCLVSFLQEANPPYLPPHDNKKVAKLYNKIRRYILVVFTRLTTDRESEYEWMTIEYMSGILYNNFVFTIPILWDLCLAYGLDNKELVSQLVSQVFTIQPQYLNDSAAAIAFVNEAFKYIIMQVNADYDSEEPPNLPETFKGFSEIRRPSNSKHPDSITFNVLKDLVVHLLDSAMTLRIFIEVYPDSVKILKKTNFVNSIVQIYEYGIPQLYKKLEETSDNAGVEYKVVEEYIDMARAELIDIFREILAVYKNAIFSGEGNQLSSVEDYLAVMLDGLSERLLIRDYHACYPVHEDIDMLRQAYPQIDPVKTDYILQAIYSNLEKPIPDHLLSTEDEITNGYTETTDYDGNIDYTTLETTDNKIPDDIKQESVISEVKDILPHLGDGFILKCLERYGFNSEIVISRILEDNLDPSLRGLDESMPLIPKDALDQKYLETGIARLNVFDGDEFDIMHRDDIDTSKIHVGKKKSKYKDVKDMLDDKTEVKKLSNIYTKYSLICDDEALYDDEYDDTFDDNDMPAPRADTTDDIEERRPFVTPRALQTRANLDDEEESEEESEPEDQQPGPSKSKLDFCINPEVLRARREASFQARRGKGVRAPPAVATKTKDVVGKPKGQGQEKEVLVNRDKKEKHKSARANHNRRQGAQWKRSQGLMPS